MNGVGGLDAISPILNLFEPIISDERGNILAVETNNGIAWNPARPTGYGAIPGYLPLPLANGADIPYASAWRGHWADITGFYNIGLRPYDPLSGRWLTFDSVWNAIDPSGMTFCGGDPVNGFDSNGRCIESGVRMAASGLYAAVAGTMATGEEIAFSPLVFAGNSAFAYWGERNLSLASSISAGLEAAIIDGIVGRGFDTYDAFYNHYANASFFGDIGLWGQLLPAVGRFVPGPTGPLNGLYYGIGYSQGINQIGIENTRAMDMQNGINLQTGQRILSAPYAGGSIFEVISELFFGNNGPGVEYASQIEADLGASVGGGWINQVDHSGGDIRALIGSSFLGAYGIGVSQNFATQGPVIGYFNNVGILNIELNPSSYIWGEPTSTASWLLSPFALGADTVSVWDSSVHLTPGAPGSYWNSVISQLLGAGHH